MRIEILIDVVNHVAITTLNPDVASFYVDLNVGVPRWPHSPDAGRILDAVNRVGAGCLEHPPNGR